MQSIAVQAAAVQAAVGNPMAGKAKEVVCAACHGVDGNSLNPAWPNLAGQHQSYIKKEIMDFKSGARKSPLMSPQAALIATPQDVADLAAYFSGQTVVTGTADPKDVLSGMQLFRGGNPVTGVPACTGCHGPTGMGNPQAKFPRLAGQKVDYVTKALKDFRSGTRTNDLNGMMRGVATHITDAEIDALTKYLRVLAN